MSRASQRHIEVCKNVREWYNQTITDAEETVADVASEGRKFEDARAPKGRKEEKRGGTRPRNFPLRP